MNPNPPSARPQVYNIFSRLRSPDFLAAYLILGVTFLAHGLWLFNDAIVHEDWVIYPYVKSMNLGPMWTWISWFNCHAGFIPYASLAFFPDVILGSRLCTLFYVWAAAQLIYLICSRFTFLGRQDSLLIALLSSTYPANMVLHLPGEIWYPFYLLVFVGAAYLALCSEALAGTKHWLLRVAALLMFFLAFSVNSMLVFYLGFVVLQFLHIKTKQPAASWIASARSFMFGHVDYLAIPLVFWAAKWAYARFFPTAPDYNLLWFHWRHILNGLDSFHITIRAQIAGMCKGGPLALSVTAAVLGTLAWFKNRPQQTDTRSIAGYVVLFAYGVLLFLCAVMPYVIVRKLPGRDIEDWNTRLCLLVGLPMAVLLVAATGMVVKCMRLHPKWMVAISGTLILTSSWVRINHCAKYQAYGVRYWALRAELEKNDQAREIHVWKVVAKAPGFDSYLMPDYCWPFYLREVYGGALDRYALSDPRPKFWEPEPQSAKVYSAKGIAHLMKGLWDGGWFHNFESPPDDAPHGIMLIEKGAVTSQWKLAAGYWYCKYWDHGGMPAFLQKTLKVTLTTKEAFMRQIEQSPGVIP